MSEGEKHKLEPQLWVDRHGDYLYNYSIVRVNDPEKAADLVQETFLAGLKALEDFQGRSSERTWLISLLKRKIIDTYRRNSSSRESSLSDHEEDISDGTYFSGTGTFGGHWLEGKGPHSHSLLPEGKLEEQELMSIIEQCIALLPPKLAAVFIMKMIDEADSEEVCKELGITASNFWVMLHRARLKMRGCIEGSYGGM